jgi:hypothetical protein
MPEKRQGIVMRKRTATVVLLIGFITILYTLLTSSSNPDSLAATLLWLGVGAVEFIFGMVYGMKTRRTPRKRSLGYFFFIFKLLTIN